MWRESLEEIHYVQCVLIGMVLDYYTWNTIVLIGLIWMNDRRLLVFIRLSLESIKREIIIVHNLKVDFKSVNIFFRESSTPMGRFYYKGRFKYESRKSYFNSDL